MLDVVVIGCGIVGAAAAWALSAYDLKVAVLEKENDVATGTTKANSAIIHAGYDPEPGTLMAKLNIQGVELAANIFRDLDIPHQRCGSLVLALCGEELPTLKQLYQNGMANGVPGMRLLDRQEVLALEPNLSDSVCGALLAPSAMIVNPWEYALALAETAVRNGAALHLGSAVEGIEPIEGGWRIQTPGTVYNSKYVLNAAGVYADKIHNMVAPPTFRIIPDRGEYYLLDKSEGETVSHIIFQCPTKVGKGTLVAPTVHGNLIVGPSNEELQDADDVANTARGLALVAENARRSLPGINLTANIRNFAGNRAASDVDDFIIAAAAPGFIDLAGIKSPGLSAAPAIAEMAVALLEREGAVLRKKESFYSTRRRVRFAHCSLEEKARLVADNPAYGRVICRCETVTEEEILDCLQGPIPPRSVDGVKRRCGPGMGRCQGGFCAPRIVELLAEHYQVSPLDILQDTGGTFLLAGETKGKRAGECS